MSCRCSTVALMLLPALLGLPRVHAHPVPALRYDRTIRVKLMPSGVEVKYTLDLTHLTLLVDIHKLPGIDEGKLASVRKDGPLYELFHASIAPLLADRLEAWQGEQPLTFRVGELKDGKKFGTKEDHLFFDFVLFAPWVEAPTGSFKFRLLVAKPLTQEQLNLEKGRIDLAFGGQSALKLSNRIEPAELLKNRPEVDREPGDDDKLRLLSATAVPTSEEVTSPPTASSPPEEPPASDPSIITQLRKQGLIALLKSNLGIGMLLLLAAGFGSAHALTPGHGKTLVAAYLVGQRGTVWHAFLLGLVTTITHTGIVIILAAILPWLLARVAPERVQSILGFAGGLLIAGLGVWLLLRRLSGAADHVHIGGGDHHHHGPGGHHHHHFPAGDRVRVWGLVMLGISGGIVPCWDAIALLAMAIGTRQVWLGLPLLLAFSAGLAGVLVLIGILVVKVKGFGSSRLGEGRLVRALPVLSAVIVTLLGIWLCLDSASGK